MHLSHPWVLRKLYEVDLKLQLTALLNGQLNYFRLVRLILTVAQRNLFVC